MGDEAPLNVYEVDRRKAPLRVSNRHPPSAGPSAERFRLGVGEQLHRPTGYEEGVRDGLEFGRGDRCAGWQSLGHGEHRVEAREARLLQR
jgi:hypothetical protein